MGEDDLPEDTPEKVKKPLDKVKPGETMVHEHEHSKQIMAEMVDFVLRPRHKRPPMKDFEQYLLGKYELDFKPNSGYVEKFLERHIVPAINKVPEGWYQRGVVNAEVELNVARRKGEISERAYRRLLEASRDEDVEHSEFATLLRAVLKAEESFEDSLERIGLMPQKEKNVSVNHTHESAEDLDMDSFMDRISGGDQIIDVEGETVDDE